MPTSFCCTCGIVHEAGDVKQCEVQGSESTVRVTRRSAANKMSKGVKEETGEQVRCTLMERRHQAAKEIEELALEEEVAAMEIKLQKMRVRKELREKKERERDTIQDGAGAMVDLRPDTGIGKPVDDEEDSTEEEEERVKPVVERERRRAREPRRRRRTTSSSASRSASRRRRSKWGLKRHTIGKKDVTRLNGYELICATTVWALSFPDITVKDCKSIFEHINFVGYRARKNEYHDSAHIAYDTEIRKMAETMGFRAFERRNQGASIMHYGTQNMRGVVKAASPGDGARRNTLRNGKRACYSWNGEQGCNLSAEECKFDHVCSKCGSKGHKRPKCKE